MQLYLKVISLLFNMLISTLLVAVPLVGQPGQVRSNGITLAYESFGERSDEAIIMIQGTGATMLHYPSQLCERLAERGYYVIRFDNRDIGLSSHLDSLGQPDWDAIAPFIGTCEPAPLAYTLLDMAEDVTGLMDALNIEAAHMVGASMGAAIAQLVAIHFPGRVISLTCMASTTGNPGRPQGDPDALSAMSIPPPTTSDRDSLIDYLLHVYQALGGVDEADVLRERARKHVEEREWDPEGASRQTAAVLIGDYCDRRDQLSKINVPAMVVHGDTDPLVPLEAGREVASVIPGAEMHIIHGMGHDISLKFVNEIAECILKVATKPALPLIKVSDNHRFLMMEDGTPFFWLGDTGWLLFAKLNREEAVRYLDDRAEKGFNVIQVMLLHQLRMTNVYGDSALIGGDLSRPLVTSGKTMEEPSEYDYWDHVDYIIRKAEERGLYMALVPVWGSNVRGGAVSIEQADAYARWLAERYSGKSNIIWINGGDVRGDDHQDVWEQLGMRLKQMDPDHLVSFHPFGRTRSSQWFHHADWLDFNMFQSGHRRYDQDDTEMAYGEDNWKYVQDDYLLVPTKPTLDGEPSYEGIPQGLHDPSQPYWQADDVRRYAYWSVFSGACGFTYGHNAIMQMHKPEDKDPSYGVREYWFDALDAPGAFQVVHLKNLMLSKLFFERIPDPALIADGQGVRYDYQAATRGGDHAFIYTFNGRNINISMGRIGGDSVKASWLNPRDGEISEIGIYENNGTRKFDPPGEIEEGNDWVLLLESCPDISSNVVLYEKFHNDHDVEELMSLCTDNIRFEISGAWSRSGKEGVRGIAEWDSVTHSQMSISQIRIHGDTDFFQLKEKNDWFRAAGIEYEYYDPCIMIFSHGKITEFKAAPTEESTSEFGAVWPSILVWLSENHPKEMEHLMPGGAFVYDAESARTWLSLLNAWKNQGVQE